MSSNKTKVNNKMGRGRLVDSFKYAGQGLKFAFDNEQNMKSHMVIGVVAVAAGVFFGISLTEWIILVVLMGLVIAAELFNTAIEAAIDLFSVEVHPLAKAAKDSASAAVLILAVVAFICGLIIFAPKLLNTFF